MTTIIPFTRPMQGPFTFQPTLDGAQYTAQVTWALWGGRYYINLFDLGGTRIFSEPLVESPAGVILQSVAWANGRVIATTNAPHKFVVGASVSLVVSGCEPDAYNGTVLALVTGETAFQYPLAADPGDATKLGTAAYNISLTAGYFDSTLVFRNGQFEVSP